jgi:hypothetical protein
MKTKTLVIIQVLCLIIGVTLFGISIYVGTNTTYFVILCTIYNMLFGISIGIGIGSRNERE